MRSLELLRANRAERKLQESLQYCELMICKSPVFTSVTSNSPVAALLTPRDTRG